MHSIPREVRCEANIVWLEARPNVIRLLAHLVVFFVASICLAIMLVITYGLMILCEILFKDIEVYVKVACIIGEVLLCYYIMQFPRVKSAIQ